MNTREFELLARRLEETLRVAITEALTESAHLIAEEAKNNIIGVGDPSWPAFAPATEAAEDREGPLLRSHKLRDSIQVVVAGHEAEVGSNDPNAIYQEHGTEHQPPRPFLAKAAINKSEEVAAVFGKMITKVFKG